MHSEPDPNLIRGHLDLILLAILQPCPKYGLEIIQDAQDRTGGYFDFKEGSLYPALHRLEQQGFVRSEFQPSERGPRRKYYTLTDHGHATLSEKRDAFDRFTRAVRTLWEPHARP